MKIKAIVKLQFEGLHCWPDAPEPVKFLRNPHRHLFHVRAKAEVQSVNREIEIIMLKRNMEDFLHSQGLDFKSSSCEALALMLLEKFGLQSCEVLEDNENGAEVSLEDGKYAPRF